MSGKLEIIEGTLMDEDGVTTVQMSAHTARDHRIGPGIIYQPLEPVTVRHGGVLQWTHAVTLCGRCGRVEGICECES